MSIWQRKDVWYYQFRYRGKQYSGRAWDATTAEEAKEAENKHRLEVMHPERNENIVNIPLDENLLKQLLEGRVALGARAGEGEITNKGELAINWQFIIEVAAGVFIGTAVYGIVSILATSWISIQ